ncbi:MAG: transglycosylase SLT domain-containing protein [Caulobacter sp.]
MVTIPRYQPQVGIPVEGQSFRADFSQYGGDSFRMAARAAGAVAQAAQMADRLEEHRADFAAKDAANGWQGVRNSKLYDPEAGFYNLRGNDAVTAVQNVQDEIERDRQERAAKLNPRARRRYEELTRTQALETVRETDAYAGKQRVVYEDGVSVAREGTLTDDFVRYYTVDNDKALAALGAARAERRDRLDRNGFGGEAIQRELDLQAGDAYDKLVTSKLDSDPRAGLMILDGEGGRYINPVRAAQLREAAEEEVRKADADDFANGRPTGGAAQPMDTASESLVEAIVSVESNGTVGIEGPTVRTGAGQEKAQGLMQVLPSTGKGVAQRLGIEWRPDLMTAKTPEGAAYQRKIGTAYLNEMLARYDGNVMLAAAAYNAGPAVVDDWINGTNKSGKNKSLLKLPDPRVDDGAGFAAGIPFKETREYVGKVNGKIGGNFQGLPPGDLTLEEVYALADKAAGSDRERREAYRAAGRAEWARRNAVKEENERRAWDAVQPYLGPDSSVKTWTAIPSSVWSKLAPQQQRAIKEHYASQKTAADPAVWVGIMDLAVTDPEGFKKIDLAQYLPKLGFEDYKYWAKRQEEAIRGDGEWKKQSQSLEQVNRVAAVAMPQGIRKDPARSARYRMALFRTASDVAAARGKPLDDTELMDLASRLAVEEATAGGMFGPGRRPLFEFGETQGKARGYDDIPDAARARIIKDYREKNGGRSPSEAEVVEAFRTLRAIGVL